MTGKRQADVPLRLGPAEPGGLVRDRPHKIDECVLQRYRDTVQHLVVEVHRPAEDVGMLDHPLADRVWDFVGEGEFIGVCRQGSGQLADRILTREK